MRVPETCAPTLPLSRRTLRNYNSSSHLMMMHLTIWVCYYQGGCSVEIKIESSFRDRTCSWVRIVNGINKYVTDTSKEIPVASVENRCTGKLVSKTKPRPEPTLTWSPVSIPCHERKWIDVDPGKFSQGCFEVSKIWIRLFRHDDTIHVTTSDLTTWQNFSSQGLRALRTGLLKLGSASWQKEEDRRKGFSAARAPTLPNISCISRQSRDIQEVLSLILHCKKVCCYRTTSPSTSTTSGTLTTCTPSSRVDYFQEEEVSKWTGSRCFFTAVNPMDDDQSMEDI